MTKKSVKVMLRGGLGNQLFQYSAALEISKRIGCDLEIDPLLLGRATYDTRAISFWPNEIETFEHSGKILEYSDTRAKSRLLRSVYGYQRKLGDLFPRILLTSGVFANEKKDLPQEFSVIRKPVRINAYCSSELYFDSVSDEIVRELRNIRNPSSWYLSESSNLVKRKAIGIHVRLGDYKNYTHIYGNVDANYYTKAIELIFNMQGVLPIWLFSDEPELALSLLDPYISIDRVVRAPSDSSAIESLNILSLCEAIVCANSSFSWWAAYLKSKANPESIVVFPRPMFDTPKVSEPYNFLPSTWITIGRKIGI